MTIRDQATIVPILVYVLLTLIKLIRCFLVFLVLQLEKDLRGKGLGKGGVGEDLVKFALDAMGGRKGAEGNCTAKPEQFISFVFSFTFYLAKYLHSLQNALSLLMQHLNSPPKYLNLKF